MSDKQRFVVRTKTGYVTLVSAAAKRGAFHASKQYSDAYVCSKRSAELIAASIRSAGHSAEIVSVESIWRAEL